MIPEAISYLDNHLFLRDRQILGGHKSQYPVCVTFPMLNIYHLAVRAGTLGVSICCDCLCVLILRPLSLQQIT